MRRPARRLAIRAWTGSRPRPDANGAARTPTGGDGWGKRPIRIVETACARPTPSAHAGSERSARAAAYFCARRFLISHDFVWHYGVLELYDRLVLTGLFATSLLWVRRA